ncbi:MULTISPECIES: flavin reductase family protein [Amycolatopsis]|uniref:NADH-FMN oxidoreductase RutF, flavin reductase (DIM6/NTAB) family n=2 Tax=Amycolatopsis TaxID=1813 RepID=A0A1I3RI07_9PSEU|nr:flavin reductase family protein [Amycolatopsis sacchari]SFJ46244.1 NADH-FMN oxidoreductase RutF, flavin reductase (DIM6/NTAB) family [Amycolatopsis sacchari]
MSHRSAVTTAAPDLDPFRFRRTVGRFSTGITVITTAEGEQVHGMTANGFLSVSLEPPLVLVSLATRSRMAGLLARTGRYGVSVLADDQQMHSQHFAGRPVADLRPEFRWAAGLPFLDGALAEIGCDVVDVHEAGDHQLFIGHVRHLAEREGKPLVFFTGSYRALHAGLDEDFFTY